MRTNWKSWAGAGLVAALALAGNLAQSEDAKTEARAATVKNLMAGCVNPSMTGLAKVGRQAPVSDKDWQTLEINAALLNEMGFTMMEGGRCPDDVWAKAAADMRAASAVAAQAARDKNLDELKAQVPKLAASCKACHEVHRKKAE